MIENRFARRVAGLSTTPKPAHFPSEFGPETILFDSGFAAPQLLPDLTASAIAALTVYREESLQYSAGQGQPELRSWLAELMNDDGCALTPENVLIVNGAKNGIDLICRLLLDEGDTIVVTAPTYFTVIPIFRSFGVKFIEIEQDEHGICVDDLQAALDARRAEGLPLPKFIYNIPEFHNPTGLTMNAARRRALVDLAAREGIYIVEDTPYRRVRFDGETVPSLKALDTTDGVLHVGTFSKLVAPGLRLGWIAAEASLITRLVQLKADGGSSPLIQRILLEFGRSRAFNAHIERVQAVYRERRDRMVAAIRRDLPGATVSVPEGGYYVWVTLPPYIDGDTFAARAAHVGVNLLAGSKFFATPGENLGNGAAARSHVRLAYSYATIEQIDEGIRRLAEVCRPVAA